jgi:hypothetical protein
MTLNKTLSMLLVLGILAPFQALAQDAVAELNPEDVLARVHFDPATYELYRPWADKWFEELGKPVAPHSLPKVEGDELVHRRTGWVPVDWVRAVLFTEAVRSEDGKEYVMNVLLPNSDRRSRDIHSSILEGLIMQQFYRNGGFAQDAFMAKQEEVEQRGGEFEKSANEVGDQINASRQELERDRREISDETLQSQIAAIEEGSKLELEMNLAEMKARRDAILRIPKERREELEHVEKERQEIEKERKLAELNLAEVKSLFESGEVAEFQMDLAEKRLGKLQESVEGLADREQFAHIHSSEPLNQLLVEAEVNLAGLEARRHVLLTQYEELQGRLAKRIDLQQKIDELTARSLDLHYKAQEIYDSLKKDEFRTPRPVIEWVPEPEKGAE